MEAASWRCKPHTPDFSDVSESFVITCLYAKRTERKISNKISICPEQNFSCIISGRYKLISSRIVFVGCFNYTVKYPVASLRLARCVRENKEHEFVSFLKSCKLCYHTNVLNILWTFTNLRNMI